MEYEQLRNYGELFTSKPSPGVVMAALANVPRELGILGTPRFLANMRGQDRRWKRIQFKAPQERGITNPDVVEGIKSYLLTFYSTLAVTCKREKVAKTYTTLSQKMGRLAYEEFFPTAEDFLECNDSWHALRQYFLEYFRVEEREGMCRFKVIQDTDSEFQVHLTDCALNAICVEAGYPEIGPISCQVNVGFFSDLANGIGGDFKRECWLCRGDTVCDWHFYRSKATD